MKIFWSWQSDINPDISKHFIKKCLEKAIKKINKEPEFSDRTAEIDHDTKGEPGSPPITDTIFKKIKNCSVFIADVTPVAEVKKEDKVVKKIMNPNVAIEMGYATSLLSHSNITTVMNTKFGSIEDLPFDLKHKRGPITYALDEQSTPSEKKEAEKILTENFVFVLKNCLGEKKADSGLNLDLNGPAIYFEKEEALMRLEGPGFGLIKDQKYFAEVLDSYFYIKIEPQEKINLKKIAIKEALFNANQFQIPLIYGSPANTPVTNKYGVILAKFNGNESVRKISDFTQMFTNGDIVSISNSISYYSKNALPLVSVYNAMKTNVNKSLEVLAILNASKVRCRVTAGFVNGDECTVVRPNPVGKQYFDNEIGPLENELYEETIITNEGDIGAIIVKKLISQMMDDLGVEFNFEEHGLQ